MENNIIHVKVFPSSKKEKFVVIEQNTFEVYVREPAQHNMANTRVRELMARHFKEPLANVVIKTGHRARKKTLAIISRE